ncbi:hypothetical protein [Flavobacterium chungangensis]|uniref:Uncharacterized protein n=1 Tax=Flavobacterium chungangensis TaxID=2708132 RepID=A0ABV8ZDB6_9FLAO
MKRNYDTHFKQVDKLVDEQNKKEVLYVKIFNADFDDVFVSHNREVNKKNDHFLNAVNPGSQLRNDLKKTRTDSCDKFKEEANKKLNAVFNDFNDRGKTQY